MSFQKPISVCEKKQSGKGLPPPAAQVHSGLEAAELAASTLALCKQTACSFKAAKRPTLLSGLCQEAPTGFKHPPYESVRD